MNDYSIVSGLCVILKPEYISESFSKAEKLHYVNSFKVQKKQKNKNEINVLNSQSD